jgi:hypothetical protein
MDILKCAGYILPIILALITIIKVPFEQLKGKHPKIFKGIMTGITILCIFTVSIITQIFILKESLYSINFIFLVSLIFASVFLTYNGFYEGFCLKSMVKNGFTKLKNKKKENNMFKKIGNFFKTIGLWIWSNKKSILGTIASACAGVATAITANLDLIAELPDLMWIGLNWTGIIVGVVIIVLAELGITGAGFETIKAYALRVAQAKSAKDEASKAKSIADAQKVVDEYEKAKQLLNTNTTVTETKTETVVTEENTTTTV